MFRLIALIALVIAAAFGFSWLAERPGNLAVDWMGHRVEMSVLTASIALLVLVVALIFIWQVLRFIIHGPESVSLFFRTRRKAKGLASVARGLVAVGAGDPRAALKAASDAERLLGEDPMTLLLRSQAAQLSGDRDAAGKTFKRMLESPETRALGLRGLYVEARRAGDIEGSRRFAEEAAAQRPTLPWAGHAVLEDQAMAGEWSKVLETIRRNTAANLIDKPQARRLRAVALTAQAIALEDTDHDQSVALAKEAHGLAPSLVPAALIVAKAASSNGDAKKAGKIAAEAWKLAPHPELADAYTHARPGDAAIDRLKKAHALAAMVPGHTEGALIIARTALEAREFDEARAALAPLLATPTQRVCILMAALAEAQDKVGEAREWLARSLHAARDPAWVADGRVCERWQPVSPVSHKLDAVEWKIPPESRSGAILPGMSAPVIPPALDVAPRRLEAITVEPEPAPEPPRKPEAVPASPIIIEAEAPRDLKKDADSVPGSPLVPIIPDDPGINTEEPEVKPKRFLGLFGG